MPTIAEKMAQQASARNRLASPQVRGGDKTDSDPDLDAMLASGKIIRPEPQASPIEVTHPRTESDEALHAILQRFVPWVRQQPEYPRLFLENRAARRRAAQAVTRALMTLPKVTDATQVLVMGGGPKGEDIVLGVNRTNRRKAGIRRV